MSIMMLLYAARSVVPILKTTALPGNSVITDN
jgi:hypothetical protein